MFHLEVRPIRVGQEAFADLGAYLRHARFVKVWDTEVCADWQLGTKAKPSCLRRGSLVID